MSALTNLLQETINRQGSDLHVISGQPARIRRHGILEIVVAKRLVRDEVQAALEEIMPAAAWQQLHAENSVDFAFDLDSQARFRVNVFEQLGGFGAVFRLIPTSAQSLEKLALPNVLAKLCRHRQGLILVSGKTGSGKSTSLAAMIDRINASRSGHILTIEDPIEFVHRRKACLISQRELGQHTPSFAAALRSALREDPDVILVGELRDPETIALAVTAAEMGIMVFGTLHTGSAVTAIDRMVNAFPEDKQVPARAMLSTSLQAVIAQQLVRHRDGNGRVAAVEILVNTPAVANIIREGRTEQLYNAIQSGAMVGMQTMAGALRKLLDSGVIDGEEAYRASNADAAFEEYLDDDDEEEADEYV